MQESLFVLMLQSVAALALVLALFAALVWGLRKLQFRQLPQGEAAMQVVQRLSIDSRHSLVEVEHHGRRYLLGLSPTGISEISGGESIVDQTIDQKVDQDGTADACES
ncbi:MAG: flagellar biosynthetic protein FliO [Mariprofundaceae bacterium]